MGPATAGKGQRVPTISFVSCDRTSANIVRHLVSRGVAARFGHNYAHRLAVGLTEAGVCQNTEDGVVRVSLLHYNTLAEVDHVIMALEEVL